MATPQDGEGSGKGGISRHLRAIFGEGITPGHERTDAQLLERFRGRADDPAETDSDGLIQNVEICEAGCTMTDRPRSMDFRRRSY